jgi:hypothetical protein
MSLFKLTASKITGRGTHLFGTATSILFNGEGVYGLTADGTGSKFFYNLNTKNDKAGVVRVEVSESETTVWSNVNLDFKNNFVTLSVYKDAISSSETEDYTILSKNICLAYNCEMGAIVYIKQGVKLKRIITSESIDDILSETMDSFPGGITFRSATISPSDHNLLRLRFQGGLIDSTTIAGANDLHILLSVTIDYIDVDLTGSSFFTSLGGEYLNVYLPNDVTFGQLVYVSYDHAAGGSWGWNNGAGKYLEDFEDQIVTNPVTTTTTTTGTTLADFRVTSAEVTAWNNIRLQTTEMALQITLELAEFIITQDGGSPMNIAAFSVGAGYIDITTWSFLAGTTVLVSYTGPSAYSTVGNPLEVFTDLLATNSLTTTSTTSSTSSTSTSSTSTSSTSSTSTSSTSTSSTSTSSTSTSSTSTTTLADFRVTSGTVTAWNNIRLQTTEMALSVTLDSDEWTVTRNGSPMAIASFNVSSGIIDITTWSFYGGDTVYVSYAGPSAYSTVGNPLETFTDLLMTNGLTTTTTTTTTTESFDDEEIWTGGVDTFRWRVADGYSYLDQEITATGFDRTERVHWDWIWRTGDPVTTTTTSTSTSSTSTTSTTTLAP